MNTEFNDCDVCYPNKCPNIEIFGYDCNGYGMVGNDIKLCPFGTFKNKEEVIQAYKRNKFGPCKCKDKTNHNCGIIKIGQEKNLNYFIIPDWRYEVEERAKKNIYIANILKNN